MRDVSASELGATAPAWLVGVRDSRVPWQCDGSRRQCSRIAASVLPWQSPQCCIADRCCHGSRLHGSAVACGIGAAMAVGCMAVQLHCGIGAAMQSAAWQCSRCGLGAAMAVGCMAAVALRPRCCPAVTAASVLLWQSLHSPGGLGAASRCGCCHGSRIAASVLQWPRCCHGSRLHAVVSVLPWQSAAWQCSCIAGPAMAFGCMAVASRPRCCHGSRLHDSRIAARCC